ncbi:methyl-accepting chemotaxis protein [Sporolactobacillus shoreicorticis]|uniref:Methyl-accepting chemotaxis protein n=1 Tax=Sporolactobacillus shoreicorticis TaxID=1923877 RepID=A0ABW5S858_9BACL|nr:methyl-accepting chemotaxis protein [Sporolactobacillus shoreicorticis]MCO7126908.1 methyl-accepting chemotaxis protein [Sporolactobacillus shoreicorticis]
MAEKKKRRGNSKFSLKVIQILIIVFVVVIPDLIIFSIVYRDVDTALRSQLYTEAKSNVKALNNNIAQFVNEDTFAVNQVSSQLSGDLLEKKKIATLLADVQKTHVSIQAITVGNNKGSYVRFPDAALTIKPNQDSWYKLAMAHPDQVVTTPPFKSTLTDKMTLLVAKATADKKAVIGMDVDISALQKVTKQMTVGKSGYAFILDDEGRWVVDPVAKTGSKANPDLFKPLSKHKSGMIKDPEKNKDNIIFYTTNPETGWKIGGVMANQDIRAVVNPLLFKIILIAAALLILFSSLALFYILRYIIKPLEHFVALFSKISDGDLTHRMGKDIEVNREFANLGRLANQMIDKLKGLMEKITQKSETLAASSEELSASTEENKATSDEIAHSIQEIASEAGDSAAKIESTKKSSEAISKELEVIDTMASTLDQASETTMQKVDDGQEALEKAVTQVKNIKATNTQASDTIDRLVTQVGSIGQINSLIEEIAAQTNLLSLNAAIEAARAGEEGKGFSVVAEEIRKLARESAESTKQISEVIRSIQEQSAAVIKSMASGKIEIDKGIKMMEQTGLSFGDIQSSMNTVSKEVNKVTHSINSITTEVENVNTAMVSIAELTSVASENSESVSAATEEQLAAMEEVAGGATTLSALADELQQLVSVFKVHE